MLQKRYPEPNTVRTDKALQEFTLSLKAQHYEECGHARQSDFRQSPAGGEACVRYAYPGIACAWLEAGGKREICIASVSPLTRQRRFCR